MNVDPQVAVDKLAGFSDPDEIAAFLRGEKVTGECKRTRRCVIAAWLQQTTGADDVAVGPSDADFYFPFPGEDPRRVHFPAILTSFIYFFDAGQYPELIS